MWPLQLCRDGRPALRPAAGTMNPVRSRTVLLVFGLLVSAAHGAVAEQQDPVVEMMPVELEASMQSSVLHRLQALVEDGPPAADPESSVHDQGASAGIPDSSAFVGQMFQLKVPPESARGNCNVHVSVISVELCPITSDHSLPVHQGCSFILLSDLTPLTPFFWFYIYLYNIYIYIYATYIVANVLFSLSDGAEMKGPDVYFLDLDLNPPVPPPPPSPKSPTNHP